MYKPGYHSSWALLVGINQYLHASPLSYACNDADSLQAILTNPLNFPAQQIITLKDSQATKEKILDEFIKFHARANDPDDRLLFFFAGHGYTVQGNKGPVGYLIPVDGDCANLNSLIRWDELTRNAELIKAKHILFIVDACYSGLVLQRFSAPGSQRFTTDLLQRFSRQVITAGKADQTVSDGGGPAGKNSIFTGNLIEGIKGGALNDEGVLTGNMLMSYVYQKVGQNPQSDQTPHFGHLEGDGDFVLITPGQEHIKKDLATDYIVETHEEKPEELGASIGISSKPSFAFQRGYSNPEDPSFGRNDLTSKLGEMRADQSLRGVEKAFSWLGVLIEPLGNQSVAIDIAEKAAKPNNIYAQGPEPYEKFAFPSTLRTTSNSLLIFSDYYYKPYWERYLKIDSSGNIEYAESENVFMELKEKRIFKLVQIVGLTWQLLYLAKSLLKESSYGAGIRLTFGLVGTRDSILSNFSQEVGQKNSRWRDPLADPFGLDDISERDKCLDKNIKIEQDLVISKLGCDEALKVAKTIGQKLDLAYNHHGSQRCFNYETDIFPWSQYQSEKR